MKTEYTINDQLDHLTVLYHRGCKQGFKFFGDDPEEHKYYIKEEHIQLLKDTFGDLGTLPVDCSMFPLILIYVRL